MGANTSETSIGPVGDVFFFVVFLALGVATVVVGLKRGDSRRVIVEQCVLIAASLLMVLPGVIPGSKSVARVASVLLFVGVLSMIVLRRRRP